MKRLDKNKTFNTELYIKDVAFYQNHNVATT